MFKALNPEASFWERQHEITPSLIFAFLVFLTGTSTGLFYAYETYKEKYPETYRVRFSDGRVLDCHHIEQKLSCVMIYGCNDDIVHCVTSYEILPIEQH